jgi:hypothetical protein
MSLWGVARMRPQNPEREWKQPGPHCSQVSQGQIESEELKLCLKWWTSMETKGEIEAKLLLFA